MNFKIFYMEYNRITSISQDKANTLCEKTYKVLYEKIWMPFWTISAASFATCCGGSTNPFCTQVSTIPRHPEIIKFE